MFRRLLCGIALASLCACAAGPDYHAPQVSVTPEPFAEAGSDISSPGEAPDAWWRLYADADLDRLVLKALGANTDLRAAEASVIRARGLLNEARMSLYTPSTTLTAGETTGRSSLTNFAAELTHSPPRSGAFDSASFSAAYELDLFGGARRQIEAAHADLGAVKAARDAVRVAVAADTARAYAETCAYGEALDTAVEGLKVAEASRDLVRTRRTLGSASEFDLQRAEALAAQAAGAVPAAEARRKSSLYALAVLTGEAPEHPDAAAAACRRAPRLNQLAPLGDGFGLLRRRPDVREAERTLAAATARIGVATASLYPSISFAGQIAAGGVTPANAVAYDNVAFGFGPALSWTFPNIAGARERIREAKAGAAIALANFDGAVLNALKDTETALAALRGERQRNVALSAARDRYAEAEALAQIQYDRGALGYFDLLDSQRALLAAKSDLAASDLSLADAETSLFRALGGGWKTLPQTPSAKP